MQKEKDIFTIFIAVSLKVNSYSLFISGFLKL